MAAHYGICDPSMKDKPISPGDVALAGSFSRPTFFFHHFIPFSSVLPFFREFISPIRLPHPFSL